MCFHDVDGRGSFFGLEDAVSVLFEELAGQAEHDLVILDEQDGCAFPASNGWFFCGWRFLGDLVFSARQVNLERRPLADLAVDPDVTSDLLDNTVNGRESEAGTFPD